MKRYTLFILVSLLLAACASSAPAPTAQPACTPAAARPNAAQEGVAAGAAIVYERTGEGACVDEVWNIYPDGRIVGDKATKTVTAAEISTLLTDIDGMGFFKLPTTKHTACRECFTYIITVNYNGQVKTVSAVDGGTDTPVEYWQIYAKIKKLLPTS
jgi:hypothetical protein